MSSRFVRTARCVVLPAAVCAAVLVVPALPAFATASTPAAPSSGGLDPSNAQTASGMMPSGAPDAAGSPASDGALRRAAAAPNAVAALQNTTTGDLKGVDVASYQHPGNAAINWTAVKSAGMSFAFVKATESTGYTNPFYAQDVAQARAAGLYVGAYHYASPAYSAVAQADHLASVMASTTPTTLPPVLDLEQAGGLMPAQLVSWVSTFLHELTMRTGWIPIIYTGQGFWNGWMGGSTAFGGYPLWDANYTTRSSPAVVPGWSRWTFWQYSDGVYPQATPLPRVPGISATVDRDRFSGNVVALAQVANGASGRWVVTAGTSIMNGTPSAGQINLFATMINHGLASRASVARSLLYGTAGLTGEIRNDYELVLDRASDPGGLASFVSRRAHGLTEQGTLISMATSNEFYLQAGSTPQGFVALLYTRLLGRTVDHAGLSGWTHQLELGASRAQIVRGIVGSAEGLRREVGAAYLRVLERTADPTGLASYAAQMAAGTAFEVVQARLYGSAEYQARIVNAG